MEQWNKEIYEQNRDSTKEIHKVHKRYAKYVL